MSLLAGWPGVLATAREADERAAPVVLVRPHLPTAAGRILLVDAGREARVLATMLQATTLGAIAFDSEYRFGRPGVEVRSGREWQDIRSQRPICVSLAAWALDGSRPEEGHVLRAVLDVRVPEVVAALGEILRLRVPFLFHHAKAELFSFWALGLDPVLPSIYDTYIAAAALHLGQHHKRAVRDARSDESEEIRAGEEAEAAHSHLLSLVGQCAEHGIPYPFSESKDGLRESFLRLPDDDALGEREVMYAAADAEATLLVYLAQQPHVCRAGLDAHLQQVEFPFAVANARMEWNGVHIARERMQLVRTAAERAATHFAAKLVQRGVDPPGSRSKFLRLMRREGLIEHFRRGSRLSVQQDVLERLEPLHPAVRDYRLHRRFQHLASEEWLSGALVGADGRTHPVHHQLGTATGRNTCTTPNIVGIGRVLRPIVTAPPGRAVVELDYGQIEVGVAAAEHNDLALIEAFNTGDVYSAIAQRVYAPVLTSDERRLDSRAFKRARPDLRERMKVFVLAVMYGMQAPSIAALLGISVPEAEEERRRFLASYPALDDGIERSIAAGIARGYATVIGGLRRQVERDRRVDGWTRNYLRNTPIQGGAAVVFKTAVVRLDQAFAGSRTQLVLPIHDAILIECDAHELTAVAARAKSIMEDTLRGYYPALVPKVEVNATHPECWNKDGRADSLERFLNDPEFRIDQPAAPELPRPPAPRTIGDHAELVREMDRVLGWSSVGPRLVLDDWIERFEERAAIVEYEGGRPRPVAEAVARACVMSDLYDCLVVAATGNAALDLMRSESGGSVR